AAASAGATEDIHNGRESVSRDRHFLGDGRIAHVGKDLRAPLPSGERGQGEGCLHTAPPPPPPLPPRERGGLWNRHPPPPSPPAPVRWPPAPEPKGCPRRGPCNPPTRRLTVPRRG